MAKKKDNSIITNTTKRLIVLKAFEQKTLRLLPGENKPDVADPSLYTKNNPAAKSYFKSGELVVSKRATNQGEIDHSKRANEKLDGTK